MTLDRPDWLQPHNFHPVIRLPEDCYVHDFSQGEDPNPTDSPYSIGRYNELRQNMYTSEQYLQKGRNIHMGIDIAAPAGEPVHSFYAGKILFFEDNSSPGDYGPTLVVEHHFGSHSLYALYGHLSRQSLTLKKQGDHVAAGEAIGWVGDESVNGGWFPHLHFQLSLEKPAEADLPGVVASSDRERALKTYPDPRWVLGPIY